MSQLRPPLQKILDPPLSMVLETDTTAQCLVHKVHSASRTDLRQGSTTMLSAAGGTEMY